MLRKKEHKKSADFTALFLLCEKLGDMDTAFFLMIVYEPVPLYFIAPYIHIL